MEKTGSLQLEFVVQSADESEVKLKVEPKVESKVESKAKSKVDKKLIIFFHQIHSATGLESV